MLLDLPKSPHFGDWGLHKKQNPSRFRGVCLDWWVGGDAIILISNCINWKKIDSIFSCPPNCPPVNKSNEN